ncbi:flagellin [Campylobacter mucosalis]|uniref:flagellin n=1 Tax=Campylobacter mucosalis TaxID=202 RepID=UPI00146FDCA5|nr:flagellin [Campylobacter mucosalis]
MKIGSFSTASQQINNNQDNAKSAHSKALQNISAARALNGMDSANLAIADALLSQSNVLEQGVANANDAIGMLGIADATLANLTKDADKLNELSVQYNSALLNDKQRSMISSQANALTDAMSNSLNNAVFNGKNVFGGELSFVTGSNTQKINLSQESVGNAIKSLDVKDQSSIQNFIQNVNDLRSNIGSTQNAMISDISNAVKQSVALKSSESNLQNNDISKNINEQKQNDLILNAAVLAQAHNTKNLQSQINRLLA